LKAKIKEYNNEDGGEHSTLGQDCRNMEDDSNHMKETWQES